MSYQLPLSPEKVHPATAKYQPVTDSPPWQVEDWRGLLSKFDLKESQLPEWHAALCTQGRPWEITRRIYQIAPLFGDDCTDDDMQAWTAAELAEKWDIPTKQVTDELEALVKLWKRRCEENTKTAATAALAAAASEPEADLDEANLLLKKFGFDHHKHPDTRAFIAKRIKELRPRFETPAYRETARQVVQMEVGMRSYESILGVHQFKLDQELAKLADGKAATNLNATEAAIRETETRLTTLAEKHRKLLEEIGGEMEETDTQVRVAMDSHAFATEAMLRYYAKGERELLDGVFTAGELKFLLTTTDVRDFVQYRADVVVRIREALMPENLWSGKAKMTPLQREMCRKLAKICKLVADEEDSTIEAIDSASSGTGEDDDEEVAEAPAPPEEAMTPAEIARMSDTPATYTEHDAEDPGFVVVD